MENKEEASSENNNENTLFAHQSPAKQKPPVKSTSLAFGAGKNKDAAKKRTNWEKSNRGSDD